MKEEYQQFSQIVYTIGVELGLSLAAQQVISSTDKDTRQIASLIIATSRDLLTRFPWRRSIGDDPWVMTDTGDYNYVLENDTDTPMFDARTLIEGGKWRYLSGKGLTYGEVFRAYEKRINDFAYFYNGDSVVDTNLGVTTIIG